MDESENVLSKQKKEGMLHTLDVLFLQHSHIGTTHERPWHLEFCFSLIEENPSMPLSSFW